MQTAKLIFICVITSVFVLAIVGGIFLAEGALHPSRRPLLAVDQRQATEMANSNTSDLTEINITAIDGAVLRAWNLRPREHFANADILFLGVDGFDVNYGLTTPNLLEARVNRAMAESARRTIIVCDSSKFGRRSLSLILPASAVHEAITDKNISKNDLKAMRDADIEVTLV